MDEKPFDIDITNHPLMIRHREQGEMLERWLRIEQLALANMMFTIDNLGKILDHDKTLMTHGKEISDIHAEVNHRKTFMTIQAFCNQHKIELCSAEVHSAGVRLSHKLRRENRQDEINKVMETKPGARNDKLNEYSVNSLREFFGVNDNMPTLI